ncbi:Dabb family protein [Microbacterium sp. B2969]|uniref:Dabb family protein n=1 Tax=Microbacterium alkaliflavum TaxID=3248839 RepID=A0ABW7Q332_9MICO
MIRHTVSFTLVHPAESADERRFLDDAQRILTSIEGVQDFVISRQVSPKSAHRFQFSMVFADSDAYAAYDAHAAHQDFVASRWVPEVADFQELDLVPWS